MGTLDGFFDDERRAASPERRFGTSWRSADDPDSIFSIFWLADTRELCALRAPSRDVKIGGGPTNILAGPQIWANTQAPRSEELTVSVLGLIDDVERLNQLLLGWEEHETDDDGLGWLKRTLSSSL